MSAVGASAPFLEDDMTTRSPDAEPLLTPAEVAALFRVDPKTVTRWAKAGKLSSIRTLGGHRRYRESEVRALLAGIPQQRFEEALDDDLNIAGALGAIFEMVREVNRAITHNQLSASAAQQVAALMQRFDTVLGLLAVDETSVDQQVEALLEERQQARRTRDFARADALRRQIQELGYVIEDTPQGPRLKRV